MKKELDAVLLKISFSIEVQNRVGNGSVKEFIFRMIILCS